MNTASTYINPLTDFGFKYLFGQEEHKQFLISFLNALLEEHIVDVDFVDKERLGSNKDDRAMIYDVHCTLENGKKIIVEMQNRYQTYFRDRALYYLSGDIYSQGKKGEEWDYSLTPVYGVFLMNFDWKEFEDEQMRVDVALMDIKKQEVFSDKLRMIFLKIPLMSKPADFCEELLDRWIYLFKHMEKMDSIPMSFMKDPVFRDLGKVARVAALSPSQRLAYDHSLKIYRDNYAIAQTERAEGRAEGIAEGRAEGKVEALKEVAVKLLASGADLSYVKEISGLSDAELATLLSVLSAGSL